ncbi:MAG: Ig-like domain-containing protein [Ekhidna sp.]|nr:Ig-like domain-containing protein [Ekhidna sp.]
MEKSTQKQTETFYHRGVLHRLKLYLLLLTGICGSILAQTSKEVSALAAGDIAFIAYNSDDGSTEGKGFAIVTLVNINVSTPTANIFFTDNQWDNDDSDGSRWNTTEGVLTWTINAEIPAGTVVLFSNVDTTTPTPSTGTISRSGRFDPAKENDAIWAYTGTPMMPTPLAAISNGRPNRTFVINGGLISSSLITGSGLTIGTHAFNGQQITNNRDVLEYIGPRNTEMSYAAYLPEIMDMSNWRVDDGNGAASNSRGAEFPPDLTMFTTSSTVITPPTVQSITRSTASPTNADMLVWEIMFSEAVQNVEAMDFMVSGTTATVTNVAGSGTTYTVTVSGGNLASLNGDVTLSIRSGNDITDLGGDALNLPIVPSPNEVTYTVDNTLPAIQSVAIASDNTYVDVTFSEGVYNAAGGSGALEASDFAISISGGTATFGSVTSVTSGGTTLAGGETVVRLSFSLNGTADGAETLEVDLIANSVYDAAGNAAMAMQSSSSNEVMLNGPTDTTPPTVTAIAYNMPSASPTNADELVWDITFSEAVPTVVPADFTVTGTGLGSPTITVTGSGTTYTVTVSGGNLASLNGDVTLDIADPGNDIEDLAGNDLDLGATPSTNQVTYEVDNTPPTVTAIAYNMPSASPTNANMLVWDITFSEAVENVDMADFMVSGTGLGSPTIAVTEISGTTYTVTVSGGNLASLNADVTLSIDVGNNITDAAGNALDLTTPPSTNQVTYEVDNTPPTVTAIAYNMPSVSPTNANMLVWDITFSEEVSTVVPGDFAVSRGSGSVFTNSPTIAVTGSGMNYTVTVSGGDLSTGLDDDVMLSVGNSITDEARNALNLSPPTSPSPNQVTYTVDNIPPTVQSITRSTASPTNADMLVWEIMFSEAVQNVEAMDFMVSGTTATVTNVTGSGTTYTVTVSSGDLADLTANVTLSIADPGNNITDVLTNTLNLGTTPSPDEFTYIVDNTPPSLSFNTFNAMMFDMSVLGDGFLNAAEDDTDLIITGTAAGAEDGREVTLTLNSATYTGNVTSGVWQVTIPATGLQGLTNGTMYSIEANVSDQAGNAATPVSTTRDFTYDDMLPTITGTPGVTSPMVSGFTINAQMSEAGEVHYVVLADGESPPTNLQVKAGQDDGGDAAIVSGTITISTVGTDVSEAVNTYDLSGSTSYEVYLVAEDQSGNLSSPVSQIDATTATADDNSQISTSTTLDESSVDISSVSNVTPGIEVFDFTVTDQSGDGAPTLITGLTIRSGTASSTELSGVWDQVIAGARLFDGTNSVDASMINGSSIQFNTIPIGPGALGEIAESASKTYTLSIWLETTLPGTLPENFDNKSFDFSVAKTDIMTSAAGSNFTGSTVTASISSGAVNTEVVATELDFHALPPRIYINFDFSLTVEAADANGNRDVDVDNNVTLSKATGAGGLTSASGLTRDLSSGVFEWTDLEVDMFDNTTPSYTFTVSDNTVTTPLAAVTSTPEINTSIPDDDSEILPVGGEQTTLIPYINNADNPIPAGGSGSVQVMTFSIQDMGFDGIPTFIGDITIDITKGPDAELDSIGIFSSDASVKYGAAPATASSTIGLGSGGLEVANNDTETLQIRVSFETMVTDKSQFEFMISAVTPLSTVTTSTVGGPISAVSRTTTNDNTIDVKATQLNNTSIDAIVFVNEAFNAVVQAEDANGNVDKDYTETLTASVETDDGSGTITVGSLSVTDGVYTFSDLQLNNGGDHKITFTSSGTPSHVVKSGDIVALFKTSDVIADPGFTYPKFFDYETYDASTIDNTAITNNEALAIAQFVVRDGGTGDNSDGRPTEISAVTFRLDLNTPNVIENLALFDQDGNQRGNQEAAATNVIFDFDEAGASGNDVIDDTDDHVYTLYATFQQKSGITDKEQIQVTLTDITNVTNSDTRSYFTRSTSTIVTSPTEVMNSRNIRTSTTGDDNVLDVIADRIVYTTNPGVVRGARVYERSTGLTSESATVTSSGITRSRNITFTIEARDVNGNLDTDEASALTITGTSSMGGTPDFRTMDDRTQFTNGQVNDTIRITTEHESLRLEISDADANAGSRDGSSEVGNAGTSDPFDVYDTTAPSVTSVMPADNATNVPIAGVGGVGRTLTMVFDEEIEVNPAGGVIVVQGSTTPVAEQYILDIGNPAQVSVAPGTGSPPTSGSTVTLTLPANLTSDIDYFVNIPQGTFRDDTEGTIGGLENDFAGYTMGTEWNWDMETVLTAVNATSTSTTATGGTVTLEFNENVDITEGGIPVTTSGGTVQGFFSIRDGGGSTTTGNTITITSLADGTDNDEFLVLNYTGTPAGDLVITYTDGGAGGVTLAGASTPELSAITGNSLVVDLDNTVPTLTGATRSSDTEIELTFSEPVFIENKIAAEMEVVDGLRNAFPGLGLGNAFAVSDWNDGTSGDNQITITTASFSGAIGDLTVTYRKTTSSIEDFGFNELQNSQSAAVENDNTAPTFTSAAYIDENNIELTFSEPIRTRGVNHGDFTVTDGAGSPPYTVFNQLDGTPGDSKITIRTQDLDRALGDLTVEYNNRNAEITDFGGNTAPSGTQTISRDNKAPVFSSATKDSDTQITVTFDEEVQIISGTPGGTFGFTVEDRAGTDYAVTGQAYRTARTVPDAEIVLTTADLSNAVGSLTVSYTHNDANDYIADFGNNNAADPTTEEQTITGDDRVPEFSSATRDSDTQITATFNEPVQIVRGTASPATFGFTVEDEAGGTYAVTGQADGTGGDTDIVLDTEDLSGSVGDLLVSYAHNAANDYIVDIGGVDIGGNNNPNNTTITIEQSMRFAPELSGGSLPASTEAIYYVPPGMPTPTDHGDQLALFRTGKIVSGVSQPADPSGRTPVKITPRIDGSTITVYSDAALTNMVLENTGTSKSSGYSPTVGQFFSMPPFSGFIDFSGDDDNGVYTFYITETAGNGRSSRGPAIPYSIAFLDDITKTIAGPTPDDATTFNEDQNEIIVNISLAHPTGQILDFTGSALRSVVDNPGGTSSVEFRVGAATADENQTSIIWRSNTSGVQATFEPSELAFNIISREDVFAASSSIVDRSFAREGAPETLMLNTSLDDFDVGPTEGSKDQDFYTIEAYFIDEDDERIDSVDVAGTKTLVGEVGIVDDGGNIAPQILNYNTTGTVPATTGTTGNAAPSRIDGAWEIRPKTFLDNLNSTIKNELFDDPMDAIYGLDDRVTIRLYMIWRSDDATPRYGQIGRQDIYLYPEPEITITLQRLKNEEEEEMKPGIFFNCEDDRDNPRVRAAISNYDDQGDIPGVADNVDVDDSDDDNNIQNGYLLEYSDSNSPFTALRRVNFSEEMINGVAGVAPSTKKNNFSIKNPFGDGNNRTGFFRIIYRSKPLTDAEIVVQDTLEFEIRPKVSAPAIDLSANTTEIGGTLTTLSKALDDYGGLGSGRYVFEFCETDIIPDIKIDIASTGADEVKVGSTTNPNSAYKWYRDDALSDDVLIEGNTNVLAPTPNLFRTNPVSGTLRENIYVTRTVRSCESEAVPVDIRTFAIPDPVVLDAPDTDPNIHEDGGEYYFEYCWDRDAANPVTYDMLRIASSLDDPDGREYIQDRSYFAVWDSETAIDPINTIRWNAGGNYKIADLSAAPVSAPVAGTDNMANTITSGEFWISKVVADSTIVDGTADFEGCEGARTKVTAIIYNLPDIPGERRLIGGEPQPIPGNSEFTGDPRFDNDGTDDIYTYYMCAGEEFPDIGLNPPGGLTNDYTFQWSADASFGDLLDITNRRGEVVTQEDLENNTGSGKGTFAAVTPGIYTYYVRIVTNINQNSGYDGCLSSSQRVDIVVYPTADVPVISVADVADRESDGGSQLEATAADIDNFDVQYNFCVDGSTADAGGLDANTLFESMVVFDQNVPTPRAEAPDENNEVLWFTAEADASGVLNNNPIASTLDLSADELPASALQMDGIENGTFHFAVVHRENFIDGYTFFDGCRSDRKDTVYVRVNISTVPVPKFTWTGITAGQPTVFDLIDEAADAGTTVNYDFDIYAVDASGTRTGSPLFSGNTRTSGAVDLRAGNSELTATFASAGVYEAELSVTSLAGCNAVEIRRFRILEHIDLPDLGTRVYQQFFETDDGGWFAEFQSDDGRTGSYPIGSTEDAVARVSTWVHGTPDGVNINGTSGGSGSGQAWSTTGTYDPGSTISNTYVGNEDSWVYSPSFDFSNIPNPAIQFETYRDLEAKDGVTFQYSTDNGTNWITLGEFAPTTDGTSPSSGLNWFNARQISASVGQSAVVNETPENTAKEGWSGQYDANEEEDSRSTNGWLTSTHELVRIADPSTVRFRFALSAQGAVDEAKLGNGFGFDNIRIFNLEKSVLVEQFSSSIDGDAIRVDTTAQLYAGGRLYINYFTTLANAGGRSDVLNARNASDPAQRRAYYGIAELGTSVLDGEVISKNSEVLPGWSDVDISIKELAVADFLLEDAGGSFGLVSNASEPNVISVSAAWRYQLPIDGGNITLQDQDYSFYFAVIEEAVSVDNITDADGKNAYTDLSIDSVYNVFRVFMPNADGEPFTNHTGSFTTDTVFNVSAEWEIYNVYDIDKLRVIAFVQDNNTRRVLQAGDLAVTGKTLSATGTTANDLSGFVLYPNPANSGFIVEFASQITADAAWVLLDQTGREAAAGTIAKGSHRINVNTEEVPGGLYFIHIYGADHKRQSKRVIVIH